MINAIGPFWDANEVWLITAGGAMFAAFPHWYATMFSGLWLPGEVVMLLFAVWGRFETSLFAGFGVVPGTLPLITAAAFVAAYVLMKLKNDGWAFAATSFTIIMATIVAFQGLYPRVMPSILDPAFDLTIYNASSSNLTLTIMLIVALFFVPIVLVYQ